MDWKRVGRLTRRICLAAAFVTAVVTGPAWTVMTTRWEQSRRESAARSARAAREELVRLEQDLSTEPRLAPLAEVARDSARNRQRLATLELGEAGYLQARDRFEESRRLESAGQAIVESTTRALACAEVDPAPPSMTTH